MVKPPLGSLRGLSTARAMDEKMIMVKVAFFTRGVGEGVGVWGERVSGRGRRGALLELGVRVGGWGWTYSWPI